MKRVKDDLFSKICDYNNLKIAYKNARRGKSFYKEVKMIDKDVKQYLLYIQRILLDMKFKTSNYEMFYKTEINKLRKIYKLPFFPDRVVQWAIIQVIQPYLINRFTANTYSSIPGRGVHKGLKDLRKALKNDPKGTEFCLKGDIKHYYQSIDHNILKQKYAKIFKDEKLLFLIYEIIDSIDTCDQEDVLFIYGSNALLEKNLEDYEMGVPIGNFLSQYSANLYLNDFDHWIKENKKVKYYFRYMDDVVILSHSKEELHQLRIEIENYLYQNLNLKLKDNYQVFPVESRGVNFLGYVNYHNFFLLRKSTCDRMKLVIKEIRDKINRGVEINYRNYCQLSSYIGWLKYCNSYRLYRVYIKPLVYYRNCYHDKYLVNNQEGRKLKVA